MPNLPAITSGRVTLAITCMLLGASCSASTPATPPLGDISIDRLEFETSAAARATQASAETAAPTMNGLCSWYGPRFHGRRTSSGEIYNQNELTAAHRSLPFNTLVRVTSEKTKKSVTVRINDRGPFIETRLIDVSMAAAAALGIVRLGVTAVELELVDKSLTEWPEAGYSVQLAAFDEEERARRRIAQLVENHPGAGPFYVRGPGRRSSAYRVRTGPFNGYSVAKEHAAKLRAKGISTLIVEESAPPQKYFGAEASAAVKAGSDSSAAKASRAALQSVALPEEVVPPSSAPASEL